MGLLLILIITLLAVILHEFGHYLAGRRHGVIADEFNVGMGKKICGFHKWGTDWNLRLFLIGGSCVYGNTNDDRIRNLSPWKQIEIFFAGPAVNLVLGFIGYCIFKGGFDLTTFASYAGEIWGMFTSLGTSLVTFFLGESGTLYDSGLLVEDTFKSIPDLATRLQLVAGLVYAMNGFLFMFNILPIPALDGGQIVLTIPELFHHPIPEKVKAGLNYACYAFLFIVSVAMLLQDMFRSALIAFGF